MCYASDMWLLAGCVTAALASPPEQAGLSVGAKLPETAFEVFGGGTRTVPDPEGRTVVLELIRSADW